MSEFMHKLWNNLKNLWEGLLAFFSVWRDPPSATHAGGGWVNRFVEAERAEPYFSGHVDSILWPIAMLEGVALVLWWLV